MTEFFFFFGKKQNVSKRGIKIKKVTKFFIELFDGYRYIVTEDAESVSSNIIQIDERN